MTCDLLGPPGSTSACRGVQFQFQTRWSSVPALSHLSRVSQLIPNACSFVLNIPSHSLEKSSTHRPKPACGSRKLLHIHWESCIPSLAIASRREMYPAETSVYPAATERHP